MSIKDETTIDRGIAGRIREARSRYYLLHVRFYCESSSCPARTIDVKIKDHDNELLALIANGVRCPLCGSADVSMPGVMTLDEYREYRASEARKGVNFQMYQRDEAERIWALDDDYDDRPLVAVPLRVLDDDRLPPTPPEWWHKSSVALGVIVDATGARQEITLTRADLIAIANNRHPSDKAIIDELFARAAAREAQAALAAAARSGGGPPLPPQNNPGAGGAGGGA